MLQVSSVRAYQIAVLTPGNGFPSPVATIGGRRLWDAFAVYDWAVRDGRSPLRPGELD